MNTGANSYEINSNLDAKKPAEAGLLPSGLNDQNGMSSSMSSKPLADLAAAGAGRAGARAAGAAERCGAW